MGHLGCQRAPRHRHAAGHARRFCVPAVRQAVQLCRGSRRPHGCAPLINASVSAEDLNVCSRSDVCKKRKTTKPNQTKPNQTKTGPHIYAFFLKKNVETRKKNKTKQNKTKQDDPLRHLKNKIKEKPFFP